MNVFSDEEKGIIATSALEIKYREQFEAEMEKAASLAEGGDGRYGPREKRQGDEEV